MWECRQTRLLLLNAHYNFQKSLVRSLPLTQEDVVDDIIKKVVERDEKPDIPPSAILTDDVSPDALHSCYTPELQSLLANIRYNGQQNGSFWSTALDPPHPLFTPPATASAISEQLMQQPLCQVVQLSNGRMVSWTSRWLFILLTPTVYWHRSETPRILATCVLESHSREANHVWRPNKNWFFYP